MKWVDDRILPVMPSTRLSCLECLPGNTTRFLLMLLLVAVSVLFTPNLAALPGRLVLALDGVSYRDVKALQEGVSYQDTRGRQVHRQAFNEGYFPVSRNVSTFPSTSDVAWTDILGDPPLPGYQRTYYSAAVNLQLSVNSVTSSMDYEKQMDSEVENGFLRALGYVVPLRMFKYELRQFGSSFLKSTNSTFYAYLRSTDDAQHLSGDIFAMLCDIDAKLKELRAIYRLREGRELEILILSDHGNNHAGAGKRVEIRGFLKKAGYRFSESIVTPKDIVLPTAGIESWVEIHNAPSETEHLVQLLWHLEGVDVLTARLPGQTNRFLVMNSKGNSAMIEWNPTKNSFRYFPEVGDPINYLPVVDALSRKNELDSDGFASSDAWMAETMIRRYPLAPERIAKAFTRITQNPATILISLNNEFVHADWLIKKGSELVKSGGTHGGLDDLNSVGILLSSFAPTTDTSTSRVAALFKGFPGLRDFRADATGADWICGAPSGPLTDCDCGHFSMDKVFLRIWTPSFTRPVDNPRIDITLHQIQHYPPVRIRRSDPIPAASCPQRLTLGGPAFITNHCSYERLYPLPAELTLAPEKLYRISGRIHDQEMHSHDFKVVFHTDSQGLPMPY